MYEVWQTEGHKRHPVWEQMMEVNYLTSGFGGLVVSMLASGTRVRGFEPGRSRCIFRVSE